MLFKSQKKEGISCQDLVVKKDVDPNAAYAVSAWIRLSLLTIRNLISCAALLLSVAKFFPVVSPVIALSINAQ
jgi:hypothetical protein